MRESDFAIASVVALVVAVPVLVGVVAQSPAPSRPELAPGAVTVAVQEPGWPHDSTDISLLLKAKGVPPQTARLTSLSGLTTVRVQAAPSVDACAGVPPRATGAGDDPWCLEVTGMPVGEQVAGTLTGSSSRVALTVAARDGFLGGPLVVALVGFVLAILLTFVATPLQSMVGRAKVRRLAETGSSRGEPIGGLNEWVESRLRAGADPTSVGDSVWSLLVGADEVAEAERTTLRAAIAGAGTGLGSGLTSRATQEATRTELRVTDFLDATGAPVVHPAAAMAHLVAEAVAAARALDDVNHRIAQHLKEPCRAGPALQVVWAREAVEAVEGPASLARAQDAVHDARVALHAALARPTCVLASGADLSTASGAPTSAPVAPTAQPLARPTGTMPAGLTRPVVITALVIVALLVTAMASVALATYAPKPSFGSEWDYLATALAGFGSGSAATVAATLAFWRRSAPEAG